MTDLSTLPNPMDFMASALFWPRVFTPESRIYRAENGELGPARGAPRYSVSFPAADLPEELRHYARIRPPYTTAFQEFPASVKASSSFRPVTIPDDLTRFKTLSENVAIYGISLDQLLRGARVELTCEGWISERSGGGCRPERIMGLGLIAVRFLMTDMEKRLEAILEDPGSMP